MAFKLSSDAQTVFFAKVFGDTHPVTEQVKALVLAGVTFEVGLYSITATAKGLGGTASSKASSVTLTAGSTSLMKGTVAPMIAEQNKTLIDQWVSVLGIGVKPEPVEPPKVTLTILGIPPGDSQPNLIVLIKAIRTVTEFGLAQAKKLAEDVLAGTSVTVEVVPSMTATAVMTLQKAGVKLSLTAQAPTVPDVLHQTIPPPKSVAKPINTVMNLKDAAALGQKVHGTSNGSIYYTIALSKQGLKLAARLTSGGAISIRAEWQGQPTAELKKLQESGVSMKTGYGSIHFDGAGVPLQKVVGAFLFGTGIDWAAMVTNGSELVVA
jgi:hypothetical protein